MSALGWGEEALRDVAYVHDGSLEGLLSAIFLAYERHEDPADIVPESLYQPRLGQSSIMVETRSERARRVRRGLEREAGRAAFVALMRTSTCDDYDTGVIALRFVRCAMSRPKEARRLPILDDLAVPAVFDLVRLERRVVNECEKARQFIRFSQMDNGVWFARFSPSASIVPLIMNHFADRLNDQPFVIYDESHNLAGIYDGNRWELASGILERVGDMPMRTDRDAYYQEAWKRFYDALANDARYNPELRRHFMPVRFWRNLPEMQPRAQSAPVLCDTIAPRLSRGCSD